MALGRTDRSLVAWLTFGALLLGAVHVRAAEPPTVVLHRFTDAVVVVLRQQDRPFDQKLDDVRAIVERAVDFPAMSRLILARNWQSLKETEKRDFIEEFKKHLSVTYGKNIESYRDQEVRIVGDRDEGRGDWTVLTKIVRPAGAGDVSVDYRLRQIDGEWKIIDLIVEKVSLVSNFRSQCQEVMANGGIDALLKQMREKNVAASRGTVVTSQR